MDPKIKSIYFVDQAYSTRLKCELHGSDQSVGPGSILHGPLENATTDDICRVEDILVEGLIKGSIVHFHRARTISVESSRTISASRIGCTGGLGHGNTLSNGIGSGGGHGGTGGEAFYNDNHVEGGYSYGNATLPCELGSGSGNGNSTRTTAGGGIIVVGSLEHPLSSLSIQGYVKADGGNFEPQIRNEKFAIFDNFTGGPGGGFGGTILMFLHMLTIGKSVVLSSIGGYSSSNGSGGGGGGRIHFHWSDIPTGDVYLPIASVKGDIQICIEGQSQWSSLISDPEMFEGGKGKGQGGSGANGTITRKAFPKGLYGTFCEVRLIHVTRIEYPARTYKNVTGSDKSLCHSCPVNELPHRGITETPCPYQCVLDRYHMPDYYTALEELIYRFGGPWLFGLFLMGLLILLALVLSVARMKFVGVDELPGPAPTQHGSQIDHSFLFLGVGNKQS
ncbi:hypothetical protein JHK86_027629 [Glycine max]|nr:hypothetical protein JHK86_027629 [Glycine max]